jgi:2-hydroxychromene-2-carboxylate isomerase
LSQARRTIDYYFNPQSPWTYIGHARFTKLARDAGAQVRVLPIDLGAVFPVSGGLPLAKRAPQRQAYRLVEMQRFSKHLGIPINLQPKFFPVAVDPVAQLIVAVDVHDGTEAAMAFCAAVFEALWQHERNLADPEHLAALLDAPRHPDPLQRLYPAGHRRRRVRRAELCAGRRNLLGPGPAGLPAAGPV